MKKIILFLILLISSTLGFAQCNQTLVNKAKSMMNEDEVFIRDFKIKLDKADIDNPAPVATFSQELEKYNEYIFRIISDKEEHNSVGILRLVEKNDLLLATNYVKATDKSYEKFNFKCSSTGVYKLITTIKDGKAGCLVIILSKKK